MTTFARPVLASLAVGVAAAVGFAAPASADYVDPLPPLPVDPPCLPGTVLDPTILQCVVETVPVPPLPTVPTLPGGTTTQSSPTGTTGSGGRTTFVVIGSGPRTSPAATTKQKRNYRLHRHGHRHKNR